ncbi:transposase family protein [Streptomyces sp. NPDC007205]|uniref:transposase family protein n=1 Tax=Streptomyces sp. NPDC007205 TaxID=3154316 RepID=UPI0033CB4B43
MPADRILVTVLHLRKLATMDLLGQLFGVTAMTISRAKQEVRPLLQAHATTSTLLPPASAHQPTSRRSSLPVMKEQRARSRCRHRHRRPGTHGALWRGLRTRRFIRQGSSPA